MSSQLTNFLKKQNKILKQDNSELKTLLSLNRQALKVSIQFKKGEANFPGLVHMLYEENSKLHKKINQLTTQLETGMCKALISQQIAFASTEQERYLTTELKDKVTKMRKQLQARQKKIYELTKHDSQKKNHYSLDTKLIEVTDLSQITKKFKDQINQLRNQIEQKKQEVAKYKDQKQQLLKLNLILTKQINEYKLITSHQSTGSNDLCAGDLSKFLGYQKKIIQDEDDPQSNQDQFNNSQSNQSSIPDSPVEQPSKISKISKLQLTKIPKLELTKAKQIQDLIVQKINNEDNKKKGVVKEQKYKKLQSEVGALRKKICASMLEKIEIQKQNIFLKKFVHELQGRNSILCQTRRDNQQHNSSQKMIHHKQEAGDTETLMDICRDVTLNLILRRVVNGTLELPYRSQISSYDI